MLFVLWVVSLLLIFEFIILLLHPLVEKIMHHNKVYELLLLVCIGAGLVPLHHKLEHLVLEKLTKNKKNAQDDVEEKEEDQTLINGEENYIEVDEEKEIIVSSLMENLIVENVKSSPEIVDSRDDKNSKNLI